MVGRLLGLIAKKKANKIFEKEKVRVDENWPLGIKIGRTVVIEEVPFLLAGENCKAQFPGADNVILAVGQGYIPGLADTKVYRIYLQKVPNGEESILIISVDTKTNEVLEVMLYRKLDDVTLGTTADVDLWMNNQNGFIGYIDFHDKDGTEYKRIVPDLNGPNIRRFSWHESVTDDPYDEEIVGVEHTSTVYGRALDADTAEYLLVSLEEDSEGKIIRVYAGLSLDQDGFKIL